MTLILNTERRWECPNCIAHTVTKAGEPATPFHPCPALKGLNAPLVPAGSGARVFTNEREDYVGEEIVQTDGENRPVMNIVTERPDGSNDLTILAPLAHVKLDR